jgi:hypothetical protein
LNKTHSRAKRRRKTHRGLEDCRRHHGRLREHLLRLQHELQQPLVLAKLGLDARALLLMRGHVEL